VWNSIKLKDGRPVGRLGRFLYISQWPPVITSWSIGLMMGWASDYFLQGFAIDQGVATVTAAIAAIAGSAWLVQFRSRTQDQPFEKYVADAVAAIHDDAFVLSKMSAMDAWTDPAAEARKLAEQVTRLHRCLRFFQKGSPYTQIRNYGARMRIELLEEAVSQQVGLLESEIQILGTHPTRGVVQVAKDKFRRATKVILENTQEVCAVLSFEIEPPSDDEVRQRTFGRSAP
jgi:hypothetical protein